MSGKEHGKKDGAPNKKSTKQKSTKQKSTKEKSKAPAAPDESPQNKSRKGTRKSKRGSARQKEKAEEDSDPFDPSPTVEPTNTPVKIPNPGGKDHGFSITLKHTGTNRLLFKIRGTKQTYFRVQQTYGFLEPGECKVVRVQPNKIDHYNEKEFTKNDYFSIVMSPVPADQDSETNAKTVWEKGPNPVKTFTVHIDWNNVEAEIKHEPEHKPAPEKKKDEPKPAHEKKKDEPKPVPEKKKDEPKPAHEKKKEEGAEAGQPYPDAHYDDLSSDDMEGDIGVSPDGLLFLVPCDGQDKDIQRVFIRNPTEDRLVFKLKCTQTTRFKMVPAMGFVEPMALSKIDVKPKPFDKNDEMGFADVDHLTVIVGKAPPKDLNLNVKDVWAKGNPHQPNDKELKTFKVTMQYGDREGGEKKPPKRKIVKTETGFTYV